MTTLQVTTHIANDSHSVQSIVWLIVRLLVSTTLEIHDFIGFLILSFGDLSDSSVLGFSIGSLLVMCFRDIFVHWFIGILLAVKEHSTSSPTPPTTSSTTPSPPPTTHSPHSYAPSPQPSSPHQTSPSSTLHAPAAGWRSLGGLRIAESTGKWRRSFLGGGIFGRWLVSSFVWGGRGGGICCSFCSPTHYLMACHRC